VKNGLLKWLQVDKDLDPGFGGLRYESLFQRMLDFENHSESCNAFTLLIQDEWVEEFGPSL
jgi:hypothetical protein